MQTINDFIETFLTPGMVMTILIVFLIILAVIIAFLIKITINESKNKKVEEFSIESAIKRIEEEKGKETMVSISEYEKEQEEKAIISYDDLLKHAGATELNYEDEIKIDDEISVKKVNTVINTTNQDKIKMNNTENSRSFMNYEKEEEFLKVLKQFRANLE